MPNTVRYDGIYSWVEAFSLLLVESIEAELALLFGHPVGEGGHAHVHHPALLVVHARLKLGKQGLAGFDKEKLTSQKKRLGQRFVT